MLEQISLPLVLGIIVSMLFSAFFSGMEIAFVSSNRMLAEMDKEKNRISQKLISFFYRHANGFVSTMLVGNNVVLVIYGILFARFFDNTLFRGLDAGMQVTLNTICSTLVVLFTGEFVPKTLFKSNPNRLLTFFAPIAFLFYIILWPISKFATFLSKVLMRLVGIRLAKDDDEGFTKVDLDYLVQSSIDSAPDERLVEDEVKIFQNALDFPDTRVRDCMMPRTEIEAVDMNDCTLEELRQKFVESGKSKIIVYKDDIDHIVGYIHAQEMFRQPEHWQDHVRTLPFVPETMTAQKLMRIFLQQKKSLGIVVDEFGGTSGLISLEDIVEEIFGDIQDEHDVENYVAKQIDDGDYILSARLEIDRINEMFNLDLPKSDEYMTLGGLILHQYRSFPKLNEVVKIDKYNFKIIKNTMTKIELVRLHIDTQ
ncbi:hemolysin family protein [Hallella colorans]|uniref:hemolysin family protein n=1 Tax=Hallella colorans TaxID=1703337 RepID=UPI00405819AC